MQHEITQRHPLLDENGHVVEAGWCKEYLLEYNRDAIKRPEDEIREWEYYLILNKDYGLGLSMANSGNVSRLTVQFMDYVKKEHVCVSDVMTGQELTMPREVFSTAEYKTDRAYGIYEKNGNVCHIKIDFKDLTPGEDLKADLMVTTPDTDKTVIVVPYKDPELFYYNYKVNNMLVEGTMEFRGKTYTFTKEDTVGTNDWGRGIWEKKNEWYWGSLSTTINGKPFGFNIGHGFGDTSNATENIIFYDGKAHKIDQITFQIPGDVIGDLKLVLSDEDYLKPWKFVTNDGRLDMDFVPLMDRQSGITPGEYACGQHQVFGFFTGKAVLDDGTEIEFKDEFGFAEKVNNSW